MTTATAGITDHGRAAVRWRLLNALDAAGADRAPVPVDAVLAQQAVDVETLIGLHQQGLISAHFRGQRTKMNLAEHLARGRSTRVVELRLSDRGQRTVSYPINQVRRRLGETRRPLPVRTVLAAAAAERDDVIGLQAAGQVVIVYVRDGQPVEADMARRLPVRELAVRLTNVGRQYLPLGG